MIPTILRLGPVPLYSFGLMMVLCFFAAWRCYANSLADGGERPELAEPAITWAAVGGIVGARLGYLVSFESGFLTDPLGTLFGSAGFVFHWGFVGGFLAVWILLRREGVSFLRYADLAGPALALGYAIGRIGCQLSGDGDYGKLSDLPWAMGYPLGVVPTRPGIRVHPAPVYETLMALGTCLVLQSRLAAKELPGRGQRFGLYLALSGAARFAVEFIRIEPKVWNGLTQAQLIGMALVAAGVLMIAALRHNCEDGR